MITMTIACFVLLLLVCSWPASEAAAPQANKTYDASTFPSPMLKPAECGMGQNKSFVCDPDKILQPLQATQLNDLITSKSRGFRCTCKDNCVNYSDRYVMMVAIVKRVNVAKGASIEEQKLAVDQFAKDLQARGWAGGNCNNDIVIVLCTEYKMFYVRVGAGSKKVLSDGCIVSATEAAKSSLTYGYYYSGLKNLVNILSEKVDEKCADLPHGKKAGAIEQKFIFPFWAIILIISGVVAIAITVCLCLFKRKHRREESRKHEKTLRREAASELEKKSTGGGKSSGTGTGKSGGSYSKPSRTRAHGGATVSEWDHDTGGGGGRNSPHSSCGDRHSGGGGGGGCDSGGGGSD